VGNVSLAGGLIHGGNTTMIDSQTLIKGGDTTLELSLNDGAASTYDCELVGTGGLIGGRDATLLFLAG
jgi:hypothetical protein